MIENTVASVVYTADGSQTQWTIPFVYGHAEDVKLFVKIGTADIAPVASNLFSIDTELNIITYPLSGDPLAANDKVIVMRVTSQTQEESSSMLSFKSEDIERMADKLTMEVQELQEQLSRCIAFNPVDAAEGELDAQQYIDDLTELKDTATTQAGIATQKAGEAATSATNSENSNIKSQKWAEGTDQEVAALGGTHSSKGWANIAQTAAESPAVQTVAENIEDINTVAGISMDVSTVSSIHSKVSTVADDVTNIDAVVDNKTNIDTVANNITNVNKVAAIKNDVTTVAGNSANVTTVATNISDVNDIADDIDKVTSVANNLTAINAVKNNLTEINAVNDNKTNINAVAANVTNISAVNANKTNIDAVAGNATNINTVATNISDVNDVADDITKVSAVADDLTAINAVNSNKTNIDTVATNISNVTSVAAAIADVSAVADDLTNIDSVADDLTNIDTVVASLPDIQDKQNKVLTTPVVIDGEEKTTVEQAIDTLNDEWVKPSDWVDIRSGALGNSVYFLVGHNNTYPSFSINATVSNTGTYDIFIDGIKQFTTASGTTTVINWATLNLQSGYDITYPQEMRAHIVRVTPTTSTNKLSAIHCTIDGGAEQAVLWAHFTISNAIDLDAFLAEQGNSNRYQNRLCEAVTAVGDEIAVTSNMRGAFRQSESLLTIPTINLSGETINGYRAFTNANKLKKIRIKNGTLGGGSQFFYSGGVENIIADNASISINNYSFSNATKLKELPPLKFVTRGIDAFLLVSSIGPTFLDLSDATGQREIRCSGSSTKPVNLVGITVSNSAPFDGSSPQINLDYTKLDRQALINLFNSMPYNVGYEVVGSPTITNGVASGFSGSDYFKSSRTFPSANEFEIVSGINLNTSSPSGGYTPIFQSNGYGIIFCVTTGMKLGAYLSSTSNSWDIANIGTFVGNTTLSANSNYLVKLKKTSTTYELWLKQGNNNWNLEASINNSSAVISGTFLRLGYGSRPFEGSIDLNNTYIDINGVPWFRGTAAMTRTCSVVGCTGTADLTQEDKNIVLNKNWELTVA